jgi:hypothetical protein
MSALIIRLPEEKRTRLKMVAKSRKVSVTKLIEEMATILLADFDAETPLLTMFGIIIAVISPKRSWRWPVASATIWTAFVLSYTFLYFYVRYYFVRLIDNQIHYGSFCFRRRIQLGSVRRFAMIQGGEGVRFLELYDANNRRLFRVADTVQDFDDMAASIREQLPKHEIAYEARDKWGKWTGRAS